MSSKYTRPGGDNGIIDIQPYWIRRVTNWVTVRGQPGHLLIAIISMDHLRIICGISVLTTVCSESRDSPPAVKRSCWKTSGSL